MISDKDSSKFTQLLLHIRAWEDKHLPINGSLLVLDMLTLVAHFSICNEPLSLKQLNALLDYSEAGIRKQLRNCISQGWFDLVDSPHDKRLKMVVAQPRLIKTMKAFETEWKTQSKSIQ